jgi:hypothetical protein
LFRGQTAAYPSLLPSGLRGPVHADASLAPAMTKVFAEAYDIEREAQLSSQATEAEARKAVAYFDEVEYLGPFDLPPPPPAAVLFGGFDLEAYDPFIGEHRYPPDPLARLQHYGVPTTALDVTFSPRVAWFFATHKMVTAESSTTYELTDAQGVMYLLRPVSPIRLWDLRDRMLMAGDRGNAQVGGLLVGATSEQPAYDACVVQTFAIPPGRRADVPTFAELFPPPETDRLYQTLLNGAHHPSPARRVLAQYVTRFTYR